MAPKSERHIAARLFANATTKVALAIIIAVLWLTMLPMLTSKSVRHARRPLKSAAAWHNDIR